MPSIILIDANSVGYAGQHAADLKTGDQPTQAIYNSLVALRNQRALDPTARIFYLWDSRAQFRFDILPSYKGKRSDTPEKVKAKEEYHSQQPFIEKMVGLLGIDQIRIDGFEADDVAYQMTKRFVAKGYKVKLVSSDKDWLQMLLSPDVSWYDPRLDRSCNLNFFDDFTGYDRIDHFVAAKCIEGDTSDNIDGVPGLGEKACKLIFSRWDSISEMVKEYRATGGFTKELLGPDFSRHIKKLNAFCANEGGAMEIYIRNQRLINLARAPEIPNIQFIQGKPDELGFFDACGELAFLSITRKPAPWINAFFTR